MDSAFLAEVSNTVVRGGFLMISEWREFCDVSCFVATGNLRVA